MFAGEIGGYAYGKNVKTKMFNDEDTHIINEIIKIFDKKLFVF
jgi:hypothetical protein